MKKLHHWQFTTLQGAGKKKVQAAVWKMVEVHSEIAPQSDGKVPCASLTVGWLIPPSVGQFKILLHAGSPWEPTSDEIFTALDPYRYL